MASSPVSSMASGQGMWGIQLETPTNGCHFMKPSHAYAHNCISGEEAFQFCNASHAKDSPVRGWVPPVEDGLCKEPNDFRFHRTAESGPQWVCKPSNATNIHVKTSVSEKENVEARATRARLCFSSSEVKASTAQPKSSAGLLSFTDSRRLQEGLDVASQPLSQVEINILDGEGGELDRSSGNNPRKNRGLLQAASLPGSRTLCSQKKHWDHNLEAPVHPKPDSFLAQPLTVQVQERMIEIVNSLPQSTESVKPTLSRSDESIKAPLLTDFPDRSELDVLHDQGVQLNPFPVSQLENSLDTHPQNVKALLDYSKAQCIEKSSLELLECSILPHLQWNQDTKTCEEYNKDHLVVFFSVQKLLEENASRVNRQTLSKLASLCAVYSRKFLRWVTDVCKKHTFANHLLCIRRRFSFSARGFIDLNSQKLPEFSPTMSSPPSKKKLANDNELRAVLLKINEVFASMETTKLDNMQERKRSSRQGLLHV